MHEVLRQASEFTWSYKKGYVCLTQDNYNSELAADEVLKLLESGEYLLIELEVPIDYIIQVIKQNQPTEYARSVYNFRVEITVDDAQRMLRAYKAVICDPDGEFIQGLKEKFNRMCMYLEEVQRNQTKMPEIMPEDIENWEKEWNERVNTWEALACLDTIKYSEHNS